MITSKAKKAAYYLANREHIRKQFKSWYEKTKNRPDRKMLVKHASLRLEYRRAMKRFGVVRPTFWLCEICNKPISGNNLVLDHNHETNLFRSWLCKHCNSKLGWLERHIKEIWSVYQR